MHEPTTEQRQRHPDAELDKLLRTELACAATYERALDHIDDSEARIAFQQNRDSHATRAVMLAQQVEAAGGTPSNKAGPWGAFTKLVESVASRISDDAVVQAIHAGEVHTTGTYKEQLDIMGEAAPASEMHLSLVEQAQCERRARELAARNKNNA